MKNKIELLKAISEPNRIRILMMLRDKPLCVCEITAVLELTTATVSKHLSILSKAGFIFDTKDGKWINYSLVARGENTMIDELMEFLSKWYNDEKTIQRDAKIIETINREKLVCSPNKCNI